MKRTTSKQTTRRKPAVKSILKRTGARAKNALERGKKIVFTVRKKAVAGAKAADKAVKAHPYRALGIAAGIGALAGVALARRRSAASAGKGTGEKAEESAA